MESVPQKWTAEHDGPSTYFLLRDPLQILWQYSTTMVHRKRCGCSKLFILSRPQGNLTKILCSGRKAIFRDGEVIVCSCNVIEIGVSHSRTKAKVSCHQHRTLLKCSQQASRLRVLSLRVGLAKMPTPLLGLYTPVFSPIPV